MKIQSDGYNINSSNKEFENRQKNIFSQLDSIEKDSNNLLYRNAIQPLETNTEDKVDYEEPTRYPKIKNFRGKESIFKKPNSPFHNRLQFSKMPDFKKHPHKWTKYTLSDVSSEDMSEKSNTSAAMSFLNDIEKRKLSDSCAEENTQKIVFNKSKFHTKNEKRNDVVDCKKTFKNSKLVMPEYVVGQSVKSKKEKKSKPKESGKELKLSHLNFEGENDD